MKTEITEEQAIGRTVKEFVPLSYSNQFIIVFEDETFVVFSAESTFTDVSDEEEEINLFSTSLNLSKLDYPKLIKAGILSKEEAQLIESDKKERARIQRENREFQEYTRLKNKFR